MFALVFGAVRTRTAQVLTVLLLTALAAAVAAAGPWFASASMTRAAAADVAAAPAGERTVSVREISTIDGDPRSALGKFAGVVRSMLPLPGGAPVTGLVVPLSAARGSDDEPMAVAYRDGFCDHVKLDGPCPAKPFEVAISQTAAQQLDVRPGDRIVLRASPSADPVTLRIVSRYTLTDSAGTYWSDPLFLSSGGLDPVFTPLGSFGKDQLSQATLTFDLQMPDALLRGDGNFDLAAVLRAADARLSLAELRLVNTSGGLLSAVAQDRSTVRVGITVSLVQILILAWFAIGLAGRYTGRDRRGDAALLKLRGTTRGGMLRLAWGQHLVPLAAGAIAGLPLGYLLARLLAGPVRDASDRRAASLLSVVAVAAVLVGGLAVLALLEALAQRRPVAELLRRVAPRRGDWRSGLVDLLLFAAAVAAVYQARVGDTASGLALAAPALVALAVALLLARLLARIADRGGGVALRAGRLRLGLTAVQVSRAPGADRVFALVVVAVAMFVTALGGWRADGLHRAVRSGAELGAQRVLTVQAANRTVLEQAVRRADPGGKQAMAVVIDTATTDPDVLAVDSSRLAAVARWRPEYGSVAALPAAMADDPGPAPLPAITGDRLTVRLRHDGRSAAALWLVLQQEGTGVPVKVYFGVLGAGEQTRSAAVLGCSAAPGCRILRWEVTTPPDSAGRTATAGFGTAVTVRGLAQQDPAATILDGRTLADITRWRGDTAGVSMNVDASHGALRMAIEDNEGGPAAIGDTVTAVDSALPLPVVLAGPAPAAWQFAEPYLRSLGDAQTPVRLVGTASALPVVGRAGVLVDLDASRRVIGDANASGTYQVWLAPDAGPGLIPALEHNGLSVVTDDTAPALARRLGMQGPSAVARFALLAGVIALLLAAATVAVAGAVDRRTRLDELTALRRQGLASPSAVVAAWAGTAGLIGAGLLGGLLAAGLAGPLAETVVPAFTDGWDVLPPPAPQSPLAVAAAGAIALAVLGLVGWLSVLPLLRRLREGAR